MAGCTTTALAYGGKAANAALCAPTHAPATLPFTGLALGSVAIAGALLIVAGLYLRWKSR